MATITGLSGSRYYVNNPIWLECDVSDNPVDSFTMVISDGGTPIFQGKFYTFENKAYIDIAEIMKGLLPEPNHPVNPSTGQVINTNSISVQIYVLGFAPSITFYRGGEDSDRTNVQVPALAALIESAKIPVWTGYPSAKYYLNASNEIIYTNIIPPSETEQRRVVNCNPVYLRFLNSKGGYSFWMFESWNIQKKTKKGDIIERRVNNLDLGLEPSHTLNLSTRAEERYTQTLSALCESPEVYIYQIQNVVEEQNTSFQFSNEWTRIFNDGSSMEWNNEDSVNEFDFKFNLNFKNNPSLLW